MELARQLRALGFCLVATKGTAKALTDEGIECESINKVIEGRPHIVDAIINREIDYVINTTEGKQSIADSFSIRRLAVQHKIPYTTTIAAAKATVMSLQNGQQLIEPVCLQEMPVVA